VLARRLGIAESIFHFASKLMENLSKAVSQSKNDKLRNFSKAWMKMVTLRRGLQEQDREEFHGNSTIGTWQVHAP